MAALPKEDEMIFLLKLFCEFFKVGLFAIGGGMATLPFLYALSAKSGWFTATDVANMIAVAESTPGAIGVNMATFAGFITAGIPGAAASTLGLILPSIIVVLIVANLLENFQENTVVKDAFYGLRPAAIALLCASGVSVFAVTMLSSDRLAAAADLSALVSAINWKAMIFGIILYAMQKRLKWNFVSFVALSAAAGIIFRFSC